MGAASRLSDKMIREVLCRLVLGLNKRISSILITGGIAFWGNYFWPTPAVLSVE